METPVNIDHNPNIDQIWADEGGRMLRITNLIDGRALIETIDVTKGWPGKIVDSLTIAKHRVKRILNLLSGGF